MIFADLDFYITEYLAGDAQVIPNEAFERRAREASQEIDRITFRRASALEEIPNEIKYCMCELAEVYYTDAKTRSANAITSKGLDGYSISFADQRRQQDELNAVIRGILNKWLDTITVDGIPIRYPGV